MKTDVEQPQEIEISAVVIRADGTTTDLGVIDAAYKDPFKQAMWTLVRKPLADARIHLMNWKNK